MQNALIRNDIVSVGVVSQFIDRRIANDLVLFSTVKLVSGNTDRFNWL